MSGAWIKVEHVTPDKPEVVRMASILKIDQDSVVGKLIRIWVWADQHSMSGNISVSDQFLDRITCAPGFAAALREVGWLSGRNSLLAIPNFTRHNGQTAKARAETARRVARHRGARSGVTGPPLHEPLPELEEEEEKDKAINRLRNRSVEKESGTGTARSAATDGGEDDFMLVVLRLVGKADMSENGGLWRTLFRQNADKAWRVMHDLRSTINDRPSEIRTTPAQFAMDLWKRFK